MKNIQLEKIEAEVAKLDSYDTFVLETLPISKISTKSTGWMKNELNPNE